MNDPQHKIDGAGSDRREFERRLRELGLRRVGAYVRREPSGNAVRARKHRLGQQARGFRQMNVVVPDGENVRQAVRAVADKLARDPGSADRIRQIAEERQDARTDAKRKRRQMSHLASFSLGLLSAILIASFW